MPGCYMNLEAVLEELERIEGVLLFSLFMLPERPERRRAIYQRIFAAGASLHGALENLSLREASDVQRIEDIFAAARLAETTERGICRLSGAEGGATSFSRFPPYDRTRTRLTSRP